MQDADIGIAEHPTSGPTQPEADVAATAMSARIVLETPMLDANNARSVLDGIRETLQAEPASRWILDMKAVRFVDSAAMSELVRLMTDPGVAGRLSLEGARADLKRRWPRVFGADSAATGPESSRGEAS